LVDRILSGSPGAIVLTGFDADLIKTAVGAYTLDAMPGAFVLTGADAATVVGRVLVADPGAFVETGFSTTELVDRVLNGEVGVFIVTGYDATLEIPGAIAVFPYKPTLRVRRR
jgi:DNA integrity scanning protein DisA with diadenylate cyclase activity